ncbi:MAG: hypothetical protein KY460_05555 [Actinobacteria bacterium]|nr:hypothetical protein [Actinomycetota bacterium]
MTIDLERAASFMAAHARVLDRRRFDLLVGDGAPARLRTSVLDAVDAYRNPDGGYGWGLEPDLRAWGSQPAAALHAFEAMADAAPATSPHAVGLCDWLDAVTHADGGLAFALPIDDPAACAPFWVDADPDASSLQITAAVAARAHRVARHDAEVAHHPWLATVTRYCIDAIRALDAAPFAYVLSFAVQFADAAADSTDEARGVLDHLGPFVPHDGALVVAGGAEGETLHLLDFAPEPDRPVRALLSGDAVAADLDRLAGLQQPDGGWVVDFDSFSPAASLEWRGYATVRAVATLRANGR